MRGRIVLGLVLVLLGLGFLFEQIGYWRFGTVMADWWPLIFVIIGVVHLFSGRVFSGVILAAVGTFLIMIFTGLITGGFWGFVWPVLLVAFGLMLLFSMRGAGRAHRRRTRQSGTRQGGAERVEHGGRVDRFAMLGGDKTRVLGTFEGGEATAFMGGVELDLREATLPTEGATFAATAIMGGIELLVPESWRVETRGPAIMGGVENQARSPASGPLLSVRTTAIMGGVEIKNKS